MASGEVCMKNKAKIEYLPDLTNQDQVPSQVLRNNHTFQTGGTPLSPVQIHQTVGSPIPTSDHGDPAGWSRD